ncbi:MAG TPA: hypothetical protein VGY56_05105 [Verrucomicrobiae bacterium]|nr:hypothetical protein [Verrucomicrobiae bacterium]
MGGNFRIKKEKGKRKKGRFRAKAGKPAKELAGVNLKDRKNHIEQRCRPGRRIAAGRAPRQSRIVRAAEGNEKTPALQVMKWRVLFRPQVEQDVAKAANWYDLSVLCVL